MASAALASMTLSTIVTAFDPVADCSDDDGCPPFSDDCGDCAQCFHVSAMPTSIGVALAGRFARDVAAPTPTLTRTPIAPPTGEILTVPRA